MDRLGDKAVEAFYDANAAYEWERLERHKMEFATTWRAMQEYIPTGSRILDVGGGPGRYGIHLALAGHRVTLLDLSAANIELAKVKAKELGAPVEQFIHGDALDLGAFADGVFDVVLLMGPLYHLLEETDRRRAAHEAARVLKPGGLLFASFITRYAFLIDLLMRGPQGISAYGPDWDEWIATGRNVTSERNPGFTNAYFARPEEAALLMAEHGLAQLRLAGAEGILGAAEPQVCFLRRELFEHWVDLCYRLGADPHTWGTATHLLYVGRRPSIPD